METFSVILRQQYHSKNSQCEDSNFLIQLIQMPKKKEEKEKGLKQISSANLLNIFSPKLLKEFLTLILIILEDKIIQFCCAFSQNVFLGESIREE